MNQNNAHTNINNAILLLEQKQSDELLSLKKQFKITYEGLRPINLIKNTIKEITQSPDLKNQFTNNLIGYTTGYLSKKALIGSTQSPIMSVLGNVMQFVITNFISKNTEGIKRVGNFWINSIFANKQSDNQQEP